MPWKTCESRPVSWPYSACVERLTLRVRRPIRTTGSIATGKTKKVMTASCQSSWNMTATRTMTVRPSLTMPVMESASAP